MPRALMVTAALLSLCGCTAAGQVSPAPAEATKPVPEPDADQCGAGKLGNYINELPTSEVMAQIEQMIGQHRIPTIRPGDAVTMDFSAERLNVEVGEDGRIKRLRCG